MKIIQFPKPHNPILLTQTEIDKFHELKLQLSNSSTPGEAKRYKNELDSLISIGKHRSHNKTSI